MVKAKSPNFLSALAYRFLPSFLHCLSDISVAHTDQYASECEKVITLAYFDTVAFGSIHVCSLRKNSMLRERRCEKAFFNSLVYLFRFVCREYSCAFKMLFRKKKRKKIKQGALIVAHILAI